MYTFKLHIGIICTEMSYFPCQMYYFFFFIPVLLLMYRMYVDVTQPPATVTYTSFGQWTTTLVMKPCSILAAF